MYEEEFIKRISRKHFVGKTVLLIGIGDSYDSYTRLPDIFMFNGAKSCEYLEIFAGYTRDERIVQDRPYKITVGDVRNIKQVYDENSIDNIVWAHGPEHVSLKEFRKIFDDLCYVAKNLIFLAVPWGNHWDSQTTKNFNKHENHVTKNILFNTYDEYKFKRRTVGKINTIEGQLFLWKVLK